MSTSCIALLIRRVVLILVEKVLRRKGDKVSSGWDLMDRTIYGYAMLFEKQCYLIKF